MSKRGFSHSTIYLSPNPEDGEQQHDQSAPQRVRPNADPMDRRFRFGQRGQTGHHPSHFVDSDHLASGKLGKLLQHIETGEASELLTVETLN